MSNSSTEGGNQGQESGTATQGQGQESTQGGQGSQGQESGAQGGQEFDVNTIQDPALKAYLEKVQKDAKEARDEAARYRTERNSANEKITEAQRAAESDQDRIARENQERQDRLDALEKENRTLKVGTAIQTAAAEAKAFNPALIASMLDAKVVLDDQGKPTNLPDLLKDLRQSDPYLFKRASNNAGEGAGQESEPTGNMNDVIRGQVAARRGRSSS